MGKRKGKNVRHLRRRGPRRDSYERILIVCEGAKTEPRYLSDIVDYHELNTANVEVTGDCGSSPLCVFEFAASIYRQSVKDGNRFDRVYCVIDKDAHESYPQALAKIASFKPTNTFIAACSIPCFELWLLLHFEYRAAPYTPLPGSSVGSQVLRDLRRHLPAYEKSSSGIFERLLPQLDVAKSRAQRLLQQSEQVGSDNPSTHIHLLVEDLQTIKEGNGV